MSLSAKCSNSLDQRKRLLYNDGDFVQIGNRVLYQGKAGKVIDRDRLTVAIKFDDGTEANFVSPEYVQKIASKIVADVVKESFR